MIQTGNPELDAVLAAQAVQLHGALEALALLSGKLAMQQQLTKDLQAKLDEALKKKEGDA